MNKPRNAVTLMISTLLLWTSATTAETIFLATGTGIDAGTTPPETLYSVDTDSCAVTTIGAMGTSITAMDFDPAGQLFGIIATDVTPPYTYYQIDTSTGAASAVLDLADAAGGPDVGNFPDMTFQGSSLFAWTENSDDLTSIDTATGVVTVLGDSTLDSAGSGTAADSAGTIWTIPCSGCGDGVRSQRENRSEDQTQGGGGPDDGLYTINPATGAATFVVQVTGEDTGSTINAMDFAADDTLWAIEGGFCFAVDCPTRLVTIDTTSGAINEVCTQAQIPVGIDAMAVQGNLLPPPPAVPAMNQWMLLALGLMLVSVAGFAGWRSHQ